MSRLFGRSLAIFSLLFSCCAAAESRLDSVEKLTRLLSPMESLEGQFEQSIFAEDGQLMQQASGRLKIKRPRQMIWETLQPYQHKVVTNGVLLWIHDLDLEQVTQQEFGDNLDQAPALLLSGNVQALSEKFVIEETTPQHFTLTPKTEDGVFARISLVFDAEMPKRLLLVDNFAQETRIEFSELTINGQVADSEFDFIPPVGVDLIINDR